MMVTLPKIIKMNKYKYNKKLNELKQILIIFDIIIYEK